MGRGDRRHSLKNLRAQAQRKKKERAKRMAENPRHLREVKLQPAK